VEGRFCVGKSESKKTREEKRKKKIKEAGERSRKEKE
jgi:hypothetical protein